MSTRKYVLNETLRFILPMISNKIHNKKFFLNGRFVGCFIGDKDREFIADEILLVYKYDNTRADIIFTVELEKLPGFKLTYYKDDDLIVFVYKVQPDILADYEKILTGNYSKINPERKLEIVKFWGVNEKSLKSIVYGAIYKPSYMTDYWEDKKSNPADYCAEDEMWIEPTLSEEIFSISQYLKKA